LSRDITTGIFCIAKQAGAGDAMWKGIWSVGLFEKSARLLVESPTTKALNLDVFVSMTFTDNETQASETKCTEACWTNYTRRVAPW
jgi:hypothetical protein